MAYKQVLSPSAACEKILCGAMQLTDAIRVTLGPNSKSVLIQRSYGPPLACKDGVTIAKESKLKYPEENPGGRGQVRARFSGLVVASQARMNI